ncbi:MAG: xanthine dehydrogenase family protein molybdopterin-binding subunit [Alphaproteobacteria bacterium]|nr:xanthine dehydrogenase family protein molybdopterin-binding subunit [Alphaproteobacteria bacterium]
MGEHAYGQPLTRLEDDALLRGKGRFTDDIRLDQEVRAVILRSPHAHAALKSVDASAARKLPGVLAVLTGEDVAVDGPGPVLSELGLPTFPKNGGPAPGPVVKPELPVLAQGRVRFVGEPMAMVVAETEEAARDAIEAIEIDYEILPAVIDMSEAIDGAPAIWPEAPQNIAFEWHGGDPEATKAAFAKAAHVSRITVVNNRVSGAAIETRVALGQYDGRYTLTTGTQMPHGIKATLARMLKVQPDAIRVVSEDVGGGFGLKNALYAEHALVLWAAKRLGRPVRWVSDRAEAFSSDYAARDNLTTVELAMDANGRFLGMRVDGLAALGAYISPKGLNSPVNNSPAFAGVYRTPAIHVRVRGVFTNTASTDVYRGAGRPEALYALERAVDAAARETGRDAVALRKLNLIQPADLPRATPLGLLYDSGHFEGILDRALAEAKHRQYPARRDDSARRGRLRGFGFAHLCERVAGAWNENTELRIENGKATVYAGTMGNGQGHHTFYAHLVAIRLGIKPEEIGFVQGDTDKLAVGHGTGGSASLVLGGSALQGAIDEVIKKVKPQAAERLEAAEVDIEFDDGHYLVAGTDRKVAFTALMPGLNVTGYHLFKPTNHTYPNGCHVAEVEVDPDTGVVEIQRYLVVHDFGVVLNPLLLKGQIDGGIAQGLGQAMMEEIRYGKDGQLLTGSLMDYTLPRAADFPPFEFISAPTPAPTNPMGVKGCGEAGCAAAPPAVVNAVIDALAGYGVRHIDMPLTSEKVWRAIQGAR